MPTPLIKATAKKAKRSVKRIEGYWEQAKKDASKKFKEKNDSFWAYVNAIVQRRSGLREDCSFKEFIGEGRDDLDHSIELGKTGFYGKAGAGAIILAKDTGQILMPYRSAQVEQPHTWGTWGGAIDSDEDPAKAALREVQEESGYSGAAKMIPLLVFKHPSGFRYHNFLAVIDREFNPSLDWETEKAEWRDFKKLPRPLHFGLQAVLQDKPSVSKIEQFARS